MGHLGRYADDARVTDSMFEQQILPSLSAPIARHTVLLQTAAYEDFFDRDRVRLPLIDDDDPSSSATVPVSALRVLSKWTAAKPSDHSPLWLAGQPFVQGHDIQNPLSLLAATLVAQASHSRAHIMSYFCELPHGRPGYDEVQGVVTLAYGLIRQMLELLPEEFHSNDRDLSGARLARLDGTRRTCTEAVALMGDLLALMPRALVCVIDGLQWLDDRDAERYLGDVVQVLGSRDEVKVLYTTTGRWGSA